MVSKYKTKDECKLTYILPFLGVTVYTPTYILNQSEVVIMFSSGAGVEVIENSGHMTARVYMPWDFIVSFFSSARRFQV